MTPALGIRPLRGRVQPYAWGSRTALAELRGAPTPSPGPEAELWLGSHPQGPAEVEVDGAWRALDDVVAERPAEILGPDAAGHGERALPFLLKVLAADAPLSIQVHPNAAQAASGYLREDALGLPRDAPERSYRDGSAKPEILCALSPFTVLSGFRPPAEVHAILTGLGLASELPEAEALRAGDRAGFFGAWMRRPAAQAAAIVARAVAAAAGAGIGDAVASWIVRLARRFPGDRGVLAPAFLHLLELAPGEAVYTAPGVLHAYLRGVGVELMAASDNVLRGGLTSKHVDVPELLAVVRPEAGAPPRLAPERPADGVDRFEAPYAGLELTRVRLAAGRPWAGEANGPALVVATAGSGTAVETASGARVAWRRGDGLLVPAAVDGYRLEGEGEAFVARSRR